MYSPHIQHLLVQAHLQELHRSRQRWSAPIATNERIAARHRNAAKLPAFPTVTVPTLCIAGRRDEVVPLADVEAFVARTLSARLVVVEDGHELAASIDRIHDEARAFILPDRE